MIIMVPLLSSKRRHDTNESTSLGCHLIGRNLHHPDTKIKQWSQQKIWICLKQFLFYSWDTGDLLRPAEEWGDKAKNLVGCNLCDISTTIYRFQIIISAFKRSTPVDALQTLDHCNTISIDDDMTILVSTIETHFQGIIPVCCKNRNNSTRTCRTQPERPALNFSTSLDEIQTFSRQNPTGIGKDTTISACINGTQFHHDIMFVVTCLKTRNRLSVLTCRTGVGKLRSWI
jgi:hypothetical protein